MSDFIPLLFMIWGAIPVFYMLRNVWLFNRLMRLTDEEALSIKLSYTSMVLQFWVWDVRKFLPRSQG
jgi:hypothetical protein